MSEIILIEKRNVPFEYMNTIRNSIKINAMKMRIIYEYDVNCYC